MKNVLKNLLAPALLAGSMGANAIPIVIDFGFNGDFNDGDSATDPFDRFTFNTFNPTSTYFDTNGMAGINTGDFVVDIGNTTVGSLNPISGTPASQEGFGATWGLNVSYQLFGVAVTDPGGTVIGAAISGGAVTFTVNDFVGGPDYSAFTGAPLFTIGITGSGADFGAAGFSLNLFGEVTQAQSPIRFAGSTDSFADLLNIPVSIPALGTTEIESPQQPVAGAPSAGAVALFESVTGLIASDYDTFTRTTELTSTNVEFVPAPATLGLLGLGLIGLARRIRRTA